ncbi:MAG: hypothetical protein EAZ91_00970 [Cytophagales bacterium]|nr:MAG: hypothetical protein EAZ91_00970 [Cytophagales bacterium]
MGETYLIDTSACSKYIQEFLSEAAADLMDIAVEADCMISIITRIEILSWITGDKDLDADIRQFVADATIIDLFEPIIL